MTPTRLTLDKPAMRRAVSAARGGLQFVVLFDGVPYAAFVGFRPATSYAVRAKTTARVVVFDTRTKQTCFDARNTDDVKHARYWAEVEFGEREHV